MGANGSLWKFYIWAFCGINLFSAVGRVVLFVKRRDLVSVLDIVEAILGLAALPALLGFAYQRRVGSQWLWMILSVAIVGLSIHQFFTPKMAKLYGKGWLVSAGIIGLQTVIAGPALWALIRYTFFEASLWH